MQQHIGMSQTILTRLQQQIAALTERIAIMEAKSEFGTSGSAVPIPGPRGPQGPQGPQGVPGKAAVDGSPGLDGRDGKDGIDGKDGKDGSPGKAGARGLTGETGLQGIQGIEGAAGADGFPGKDGEPGQRGEIGPVGPPGPQGVCNCQCESCGESPASSADHSAPEKQSEPSSASNEETAPDQPASSDESADQPASPKESADQPASYSATSMPTSQDSGSDQPPSSDESADKSPAIDPSNAKSASDDSQTFQTKDSGSAPVSSAESSRNEPSVHADIPVSYPSVNLENAAKSDYPASDSSNTPPIIASLPPQLQVDDGESPVSDILSSVPSSFVPAGFSDEVPVIPSDILIEAPAVLPSDVSIEMPVVVPFDIPIEMPVIVPFDVPTEMPVAVSSDDSNQINFAPSGILDEALVIVPSDISNEVLGSLVSDVSDITDVQAIVPDITGQDPVIVPSDASEVVSVIMPFDGLSDSDIIASDAYIVANETTILTLDALLTECPVTDIMSNDDDISKVSNALHTIFSDNIVSDTGIDPASLVSSDITRMNEDVLVPGVQVTSDVPSAIVMESFSAIEAVMPISSTQNLADISVLGLVPVSEPEPVPYQILDSVFIDPLISDFYSPSEPGVIQPLNIATEVEVVAVSDSTSETATIIEELRADMISANLLTDDRIESALVPSNSPLFSFEDETITPVSAPVAVGVVTCMMDEVPDADDVEDIKAIQELTIALEAPVSDVYASSITNEAILETSALLQLVSEVFESSDAIASDALPIIYKSDISEGVRNTGDADTRRVLNRLVSQRPIQSEPVAAEVTQNVVESVAPTLPVNVRGVLSHFVETILSNIGGGASASSDVLKDPTVLGALEGALKDLGSAEDIYDFVAKREASSDSLVPSSNA